MGNSQMPVDAAGAEVHVAVRGVVAQIAVRFGGKVPSDLEIVIRYYIGAHNAFLNAAGQLLAVARAYGIDGGAR